MKPYSKYHKHYKYYIIMQKNYNVTLLFNVIKIYYKINN